MKRLPTFASPPVSEVVMSADMAPIAGWEVPHFGLFWAQIRDEFPTFRVLPSANPEVEDFASAPPVPPQVIHFQFEPDPNALRCWFLTQDQTQLLQVQRDRFIQNWRKWTGSERYPRYEDYLRPAFQKRYSRFKSFLGDAGLPVSEVLQVEMSYINDIVPGEGGASPSDLQRLLSPWRGEFTEGFLPPPYGTRISASFAMPDQRGRLHVNLQRVIRPRDQVEILQFRLTSRVKPVESTDEKVLNAFDVAREWIVRGFADWTTPAMHKIWGRED